MTPGYITALCAVLTLIGLGAGWLVRAAKEDGKRDQILANLLNLITKHDEEIRELQRELYAPVAPPRAVNRRPPRRD